MRHSGVVQSWFGWPMVCDGGLLRPMTWQEYLLGWHLR